MRVQISAVNGGEDHPIFGLYQGGPWGTVMPPPGGLGFGRYIEADELEVLPDDAIDATDEEQQAQVERRLD